VIQFTTKIIDTGCDSWKTGPNVCIAKPKHFEDALIILLEQAEKKAAGYINVRLDLPHRPRTTGWKSQNHHLRGHARQLCGYTGFTMGEMMQIIKEDTSSWPVEYKEFRGKRRMIHKSEADISMEVASEAIEICHRIAVDNEWILKESD
jgi:hypothetical protein